MGRSSPLLLLSTVIISICSFFYFKKGKREDTDEEQDNDIPEEIVMVQESEDDNEADIATESSGVHLDSIKLEIDDPLDLTNPNRKVRSIIMGCNYENTDSSLNGCVSDAQSIYDLFMQYSEKYESFEKPISLFDKNIDNFSKTLVMSNLQEAYYDSKPGDVLFVYFAGHGLQIEDLNHDEISDTMDECCLLTCNPNQPMEWILDDDLKLFLNRSDVTFVLLLDCCHSGGMSDITIDRPNNLVISACTENQTSKEVFKVAMGVRGVFTSNLEAICKSAESDLTISEISNHKIWKDINENYDQKITVFGDESLFKFPKL